MNFRNFVLRLFNIHLAALASLIYVGTVQAEPAGDPSAGSDVFATECSDCHSVRQGKNKKGPSLFGVVGRKSGSIADFKYSDGMRALNIVWTPEKIDAYITKPKAVVPDGKMKYDGLANAKARADVLAFLATKK